MFIITDACAYAVQYLLLFMLYEAKYNIKILKKLHILGKAIIECIECLSCIG